LDVFQRHRPDGRLEEDDREGEEKQD